jgi:hypothetical protein
VLDARVVAMVVAMALPVVAMALPVGAMALPVVAMALPVGAMALPVGAKALPVGAKAAPVGAKAQKGAKVDPAVAKVDPAVVQRANNVRALKVAVTRQSVLRAVQLNQKNVVATPAQSEVPAVHVLSAPHARAVQLALPVLNRRRCRRSIATHFSPHSPPNNFPWLNNYCEVACLQSAPPSLIRIKTLQPRDVRQLIPSPLIASPKNY